MIIEERLKTAHGTAQRARERAIEADVSDPCHQCEKILVVI